MLTDTGDMLHVFCHNNSRMSERHFEFILLWNVPHNSHTMPISGTYYSHFMPKVCPKCGTYILCDQIMPKVWHIVCNIVCPKCGTYRSEPKASDAHERSGCGICGQRVLGLLSVCKSAVIVDNQVSDFQC